MKDLNKKLKKAFKKDPYLRKHSLLKNILFNLYYPNLNYKDFHLSEIWIDIARKDILRENNAINNIESKDFSLYLWGKSEVGPVG